jgi:hypothetical protein
MGDAIVASVLDPDLKIKNECLPNSGDGYGNGVAHTCHKYYKDPEPATTGESVTTSAIARNARNSTTLTKQLIFLIQASQSSTSGLFSPTSVQLLSLKC